MAGVCFRFVWVEVEVRIARQRVRKSQKVVYQSYRAEQRDAAVAATICEVVRRSFSRAVISL